MCFWITITLIRLWSKNKQRTLGEYRSSDSQILLFFSLSISLHVILLSNPRLFFYPPFLFSISFISLEISLNAVDPARGATSRNLSGHIAGPFGPPYRATLSGGHLEGPPCMAWTSEPASSQVTAQHDIPLLTNTGICFIYLLTRGTTTGSV